MCLCNNEYAVLVSDGDFQAVYLTNYKVIGYWEAKLQKTKKYVWYTDQFILVEFAVFQVQLKTNISSQYVIRTQPTNNCLSTLECAAVALTIMEKNKSIQEVCKYLCKFQILEFFCCE